MPKIRDFYFRQEVTFNSPDDMKTIVHGLDTTRVVVSLRDAYSHDDIPEITVISRDVNTVIVGLALLHSMDVYPFRGTITVVC